MDPELGICYGTSHPAKTSSGSCSKYAIISSTIFLAGTYLSCNIAQIVTASMIIHQSESYYEDNWKVQAAVITSLIVSILEILHLLGVIALSAVGEKESAAKSSGIVGMAQIFALVMIYLSWSSMSTDQLGHAFCIIAGIIWPSIVGLAIITYIFLLCTIGLEDD
jgi:hypothetical protein